MRTDRVDGIEPMNRLEQLIAEEISSLLRERGGVASVAIDPDTSLADDLALDSLLFVDLTLRLEARLGIPELPLRDWADAESLRPGRRFTLRSLSDYTSNILSEDGHSSRDGAGAAR